MKRLMKSMRLRRHGTLASRLMRKEDCLREGFVITSGFRHREPNEMLQTLRRRDSQMMPQCLQGCDLRPGRISKQARHLPMTAQVSWPYPELSHILDIAARLSIEPLSFKWAFPRLVDARVHRARMLDRDNLELQDERRHWINEISIFSRTNAILSDDGSALEPSATHLRAQHFWTASDSRR
jgi:hypothetical protein